MKTIFQELFSGEGDNIQFTYPRNPFLPPLLAYTYGNTYPWCIVCTYVPVPVRTSKAGYRVPVRTLYVTLGGEGTGFPYTLYMYLPVPVRTLYAGGEGTGSLYPEPVPPCT